MLRRALFVLFGVTPLWFLLLSFLFPGFAGLLGERWVITPLAVAAAAFANATAVGGGFVFMPLFAFGYGLPPVAALKLSLATQCFGMSAGALTWSRRFINGRALQITLPAALLGVVVGTLFPPPPDQAIKMIFGVVSLGIATAVLAQIRAGRHTVGDTLPEISAREHLCVATICFLGGVINALVSIGIGEVVALWLLFRHRMRIEIAIGTGVLVLALSSIVATAIHIGLGGIPWSYLAFTAPGVALGGHLGARLGKAFEARAVECPAARWWSRSPLKLCLAAVALIDGLTILGRAVL